MNVREFEKAFPILRKAVRIWDSPAVEKVALAEKSPFRILVSTILSARTRDEATHEASKRLFLHARSPREILRLPVTRLEKLIFPVGFYKTKARNLRMMSHEILERFGGRVPSTLEDLLSLPGVGRKTANLVLILGFRKEGICVDTHVHRITNRLGFVKTETPEQTEMALRKKLPGEFWMEINAVLVAFGRNLCTPLSPHCSRCPVRRWCRRVGVIRWR